MATRPTYSYQEYDRWQVRHTCPRCGEEAELTVRTVEVKAKVNFLIPLGTYREVWAACSQCGKEFTTTPDLSRELLPSRKAKRLHLAAWLTLPIPFVSLILMILTLRNTPKTSNSIRMWSLIGLVPTGMITLMVLFLLISL
jgi:hypothetical protein